MLYLVADVQDVGLGEEMTTFGAILSILIFSIDRLNRYTVGTLAVVRRCRIFICALLLPRQKTFGGDRMRPKNSFLRSSISLTEELRVGILIWSKQLMCSIVLSSSMSWLRQIDSRTELIILTGECLVIITRLWKNRRGLL